MEETINEVKRIYEGAEVLINIKNKNAKDLKRTPVICCANYHPWQFVILLFVSTQVDDVPP